MIVALFALSVAMMIGGIASVIQGFPFVRLESGLAMTIAGAGVASAGAVLFGIGVVASRLKRVEEALGFRRLADEVRPSTLPGTASEAVIVPPTVEPAPPPAAAPVAALAGLAAGGLAGAGLVGARTGREPVFDGSTFGTPAPGDPPLPEYGHTGDHTPGHDLREPDLPEHAAHTAPDPLFAEPGESEPELPLPTPPGNDAQTIHIPEASHAQSPEPEPEPTIAPEDDLFGGPELLPAASGEHVRAESPPVEEEAPALRPALSAEDAPAAEPEPEPKPVREVVGTYASGGNTYVMYSDGAIEAETPRGRFSFGSLDELKAFVDAGGEADRGAA